jgi:hypothetical protein
MTANRHAMVVGGVASYPAVQIAGFYGDFPQTLLLRTAKYFIYCFLKVHRRGDMLDHFVSHSFH